MAVTLGTYQFGRNNAAAWSVFTNPDVTPWYVSDSAGSDSNDGKAPVFTSGTNGPFKTLAKLWTAVDGARSTTTAQWALLRRGDSFIDQDFSTWPSDPTGAWRTSGNIAGQNPTVISNYDPAIAVVTSTGAGVNPAASLLARPVIAPFYNRTAGCFPLNANCDYLAFVGLNFHFKRGDPADASFAITCTQAFPNAPGTGYHLNDLITVTATGGTTLTPAVFLVTGVDNSGGAGIGGITAVDTRFTTNSGRYVPIVGNMPTAFTHTSGGSGTGATFTAPSFQYGNPVGILHNGTTSNTWWLVEDCRFDFCVNGCDFAGPHNGIMWRRNAYNNGYVGGTGPEAFSHSGSIHGNGGVGWAVEESVLFHGGWCETAPFADAVDPLNHNYYMDQGGGGPETQGPSGLKGDLGIYSGTPTVLGNLSSAAAGSGNFRPGATASNNCFLREDLCHGLTSWPATLVSAVDSVYIECHNFGIEDITGVNGGGFYVGIEPVPNTTASVKRNIFANTIDTTAGFAITTGNGFTVQNNIVYNWGPSNRTPSTVCPFNNTAINTLDTLVGGSGYTPQTTSISGITRESGTNYVILTVGSSGSPLSNVVGPAYLEGIVATSGLDTFLNGKMWTVAPYGNPTQVIVLNTASAPAGTYSSGGAVCIPYFETPLTGGSGSGAVASIAVNSAGAVAAISFMVRESSGVHFQSPGTGYVVGNSLGASSLPGGSGFSVRVASLTSNTVDGTNIFDPQATHPDSFYGFLDSTRSAQKYYILIGLPGGFPATRDGFIQACLANTKNNWNGLLTAPSFNDYIRQGFSIPMLGSTYADQFGSGVVVGGGTTVTHAHGVYKTRPTKVPHS